MTNGPIEPSADAREFAGALAVIGQMIAANNGKG